MNPNKALQWVILWIIVALLFNIFIYYLYGLDKAMEFFTGYVIEKSLSVDNLFVFLVLFRHFGISLKKQRRVLNWGILGVIILRGIFISLGAVLVSNFGFVLYLFGVILIYSGYKLTFNSDEHINPDDNSIVKFFKRFLKVDSSYQGDRFFLRRNGVIYVTPMFICLIAIESTDLVFAIDSVPAIFAITNDIMIIFSSNILAILGLRSMYFLLYAVSDKFLYVKKGVGVILIYIGVKMLIPLMFEGYHIPVWISLLIILFIIIFSVLFSFIFAKRNESL
ncbi:MAG: TerC/Alx family metal homeostasis membrane protein [Ignavibacteria bacterium]|nr:TerC/Alx family metal homeostasis membrane protein [Ignavibacteria bacterium]